MEGNIVKDFQNLKVFAQRNLIKMDELVQDLTSALEESASMGRPGSSQADGAANSGSCSRRYIKKRRGIRRSANNYYYKRGTISEASESSIDEQPVRDYAGNVIHSDSDDLTACHRIPKLTMPFVDPAPTVESDSFTENLSPLRPQRRRRKLKNMAVDSSPVTDHIQSDADSVSGDRQASKRNTNTYGAMQGQDRDRPGASGYKGPMPSPEPSGLQTVTAGKRKRASKSRTDCSSYHRGSVHGSFMEVASISQESSLSSSEFDSDINANIEDAREADDEQSDFFHEPGPACGIPDIVPWWENERVTDEPLRMDSDFEKILTGTFAHLPKLSSQSFKARMGRLMSGSEREIRLGRRKLKGKMPRYTVGRFLQDREHWNRMQSCHGNGGSMQPPGCSSGSSSNLNNSNSSNGHGTDTKRRKHITRSSALHDTGMPGPTSDALLEASSSKHLRSSISTSCSRGMHSPGTCLRKGARKNGGAYSNQSDS